MRQLTLLLLVGGVVALCVATAPAATIHVPADQPTIQAAVTAASSGDTIFVSPGSYAADIQVQKSLSLISDTDANSTFINGNFTVATECGLVVEGFTFVGGSGTVLNTEAYSALTIRKCVFDGFSANECARGGEGVTVKVSYCLFRMTNVQNPIVAVGPMCEFINNTVFGGNGNGLAIYGPNAIIKNNIVTNLPGYGIHGADVSSDVSYNDFWQNSPNYSSTIPGAGSISADPQFADTDANLTAGSPCINAGDPSLSYNDIDGSRNDMGARPLLCEYLQDSSDCDSDGYIRIDDNCPVLSNPSQSDSDADGIGDACDNCPNDPLNDQDADGVCGDIDNCPSIANAPQNNSDGDGFGDVCDSCPNDPLDDADGDGICGDVDNCPSIANVTQSDEDGDDTGDVCDDCTDTDRDGYGDPGFPSNTCPLDNCLHLPNSDQEDSDNDGFGNVCDNCPGDFNPSQTDLDGDGLGDICDECLYDPGNDADHDGICGDIDNCPSAANSSQADTDADGVGDVCDNCPTRFNPEQEETDGDGIADSCDNCPTVFNASQTDVDGDGIGNACDVCLTDPLNDEDGDGVCHGVDNCPTAYNPDQVDANSNGIGDVCDCQCPCHADPACDTVKSDILDVVNTVNVAFRGTSPMTDLLCPRERTDVDCTGSTDVLDVVKTLDVAFRGANPGVTYCHPCGAPLIVASRDTIHFYCYPYFATDTFTLANAGSASGSYSLTTSADWLAFDNGDGNIPAGSTIPVIATAYCTPPPSNQTWIYVRSEGVLTDSIYAWKVELPMEGQR